MGMHDWNLTDLEIMGKISDGRPGTRQWPDQGGLILHVVVVMREEHKDRHLGQITVVGPHAALIQPACLRQARRQHHRGA